MMRTFSGQRSSRSSAVEQVLRESRDLEEPLGQLALLDQRARAPAAAVDHLLVGEHGLVDRVPVHLRLLALDQAGREEVEEHLLLVLVVVGIAGRDLARPVERQPHRLELRLHRLDVLVGPGARMDLALHGGVLGRHAEGVPAHRMQHVEAHGALVARHHVAHRVVAHVPHVDAPRRIGEHLQHVVFRARVVVAGGEDARARPTPSASAARPRGRCSGRWSSNFVLCSARKNAAPTRTRKAPTGQRSAGSNACVEEPPPSVSISTDRAVGDHGVAAAALGGVEAGVGGLDQLLGLLAEPRRQRGDADADRHLAERRVGVRDAQLLDRAAQPLGDLERLVGVGAGQQQRELLAAVARRQVVDAGRRRPSGAWRPGAGRRRLRRGRSGR